MRRLLICICYITYSICSNAQQFKYEIGALGGISTMIGDINQNLPIYSPGLTYGACFRYNMNYRWAVKVNLISAKVSGDTKDFSNVFPDFNGTFKSSLYDLGGQVEFNFFNYGITESYLNSKRFTPYLSAGLGLVVAHNDKTAAALSLPIGVGVKYKLVSRVNAIIEFSLVKTFSDRMDLSTLEDPYHIQSTMLKNTDWYSLFTVGVTYDFGFRKKQCNNIE